MKVLHVIPSISQKRGGPSFAIFAMTAAVAQCGIEVDIAVTDDDGEGRLVVPLEEPINEKGVTIRYFRRQTSFYTFSWPLTRWLWEHVHEYDLLHIHSLFSYATLPAAWFAHWRRVPYIIRPLGHLNRWGLQNRRATLKRLSLRWIEGPILQRTTLLHFTSEQEWIEAQEVGVTGPAAIAPLGIDTTPFQQLPPVESFVASYPQTQNKTRLLFLSRIDPKKGLDLLLSAFSQLLRSHADIVLVIAGDGDATYLAELKSLAQRLGIDDAIIWAGFLTGQSKLAALAAADLFVLPSYSENFGIAVVEAMAAGLPVVISDQVGIHYEVTKGNAGVVTACSAGQLAAVLKQLIVAPAQLQVLGSNAKRVAEEYFSQAAMTHRLLTMYEDVYKAKKQARRFLSDSPTEILR